MWCGGGLGLYLLPGRGRPGRARRETRGEGRGRHGLQMWLCRAPGGVQAQAPRGFFLSELPWQNLLAHTGKQHTFKSTDLNSCKLSPRCFEPSCIILKTAARQNSIPNLSELCMALFFAFSLKIANNSNLT